MIESILKRYSELTENDITLRDDSDGKGIYIDVWNSDKPKPTMTEVFTWVEEDSQLPRPKSDIAILQEENENLNIQLQQVNNDLSDFMDFIISGGA